MLRLTFSVIFSLLLLNGCTDFKENFTPLDIEPMDEMQGPGLLTGEDGEFKIPLPDSWNASSAEEETVAEMNESETEQASCEREDKSPTPNSQKKVVQTKKPPTSTAKPASQPVETTSKKLQNSRKSSQTISRFQRPPAR